MQPVLVVGSVAFDSIETPFGVAGRVVGGAATYFAVAAAHFTDVRMVAVVGEDFTDEQMGIFRGRRIDLTGLQQVPGETFRWKGKYSEDLNDRESIYTFLNVFEEFQPILPPVYRASPFVFLGNIHPRLQLEVLDQVESPEFVVADTMNYWIEKTPEELHQVLTRVDALVINDAEARQLSKESNLVKAVQKLQAMGPRLLIIKRGEHGVLMFGPDGFFAVPGLPLNTVRDPTGAGDTFGGGLLGYLAGCSVVNHDTLTRAVIAGSTMASFSVEAFGLERLLCVTSDEIQQRFLEFRRLTSFNEL
ncbi:MAG: sugar kinase [Acidobacteria bacterium]|nr:sugar kinase [Acidobacteriota bacterium]|tara:strand:+ start:755 stop:1666 length:912 start_codon:yes stop_codon:yes gene_type:complete